MSGSLINRISGTPANYVPKVGDGATELCYSDRHAYTIIAVSVTETACAIQRDTVTRLDKNGMSDSQTYEYAANPEGEVRNLRKNARGEWKEGGQPKGSTYALGYRSEYHDYSF